MNFLLQWAEISITSGEISLKPFSKIGNVDLSAIFSAIFNAFNLSSELPWKRVKFLFLWEILLKTEYFFLKLL